MNKKAIVTLILSLIGISMSALYLRSLYGLDIKEAKDLIIFLASLVLLLSSTGFVCILDILIKHEE